MNRSIHIVRHYEGVVCVCGRSFRFNELRRSSIRLHNRVCEMGGFHFDEDRYHVGVQQINRNTYDFQGRDRMEIQFDADNNLENSVKPNKKKRVRDDEATGEESEEQKKPKRKRLGKKTVLPTMGKELPSASRNPDNDGSGNVQPVS